MNDETISMREVVLAASQIIGKTELDIVGVFLGKDNQVKSEVRQDAAYVIFTDDTSMTITWGN